MYLYCPSAYAELSPEVYFANSLSSLAINVSDNETPTERLLHSLIDLSERFSWNSDYIFLVLIWDVVEQLRNCKHSKSLEPDGIHRGGSERNKVQKREDTGNKSLKIAAVPFKRENPACT